MNAPIRELPSTEVPRPLVLVAATTCGVLAAIAAQIVLAQRGIELAGIWRESAARGFHLRAAGAWWMMPGSALLVGAAVASGRSALQLRRSIGRSYLRTTHRLRQVAGQLSGTATKSVARAYRCGPARTLINEPRKRQLPVYRSEG